jgi:hypothetical protein
MFSLFKKTTPFTDIEKTIPRRELIENSLKVLDSLKFKLETNYSEILPRNHLYVVQCINDNILAANKVLKVLNLLRQNNIDLRMWPKMKSEAGEIYCKYEQEKFYVSFPWNHPFWISPIKGVERFVRECKHKIELANKAKFFLDKRIDLTKEESEILVLSKN